MLPIAENKFRCALHNALRAVQVHSVLDGSWRTSTGCLCSIPADNGLQEAGRKRRVP